MPGAKVSMQSRPSKSAGFTLIEILIVIGLIALVTAVAVPSLTNVFRASAESFAKQTALLLREARDRALLTDKLIRLRIDLDKQELWLEEAPSSYMLPKPKDRLGDSREEEEKAKLEADAFRMVKQLTKEKRPVPKGIRITEVITPRQKDPVKEGVVDVYFFNNGNADGVSIRFETDEKTAQGLTLHPVTGQSRIGPAEAKP
jgi:general secretion pathway protein H